MFLSNSVNDQSAQWFLEFSFGVHRIPLRDHCNLTELSKIVMCGGIYFYFFLDFSVSLLIYLKQ